MADTYAGERLIFDADSHIMESRGWLLDYADEQLKAKLGDLGLEKAGRISFIDDEIDKARARVAGKDPEGAAKLKDELLLHKGWSALGATFPEERPAVLDKLGFQGQLVFSTFAGTQFRRTKDLDILYGGADAMNRGMVDFCSVDRRLYAVGYVPLTDLDRAVASARAAIKEGCRAIHVPADALPEVSPAHPSYDKFWGLLAETNTPFVLHIGGEQKPIVARSLNNNGHKTTDHLGGGENIRSKDYMAIHHAPELFLAALVLDGVFERHPDLRGGVIEDGAMWVVTWLKRLDYAQKAFARGEPHLKLPELASEYVRKHLRFTPFPHEPVGWMIEQAGAELFMFSSDFPHPEGTKDPIGRFESSLAGVDEEARLRFYANNFLDLMGMAA